MNFSNYHTKQQYHQHLRGYYNCIIFVNCSSRIWKGKNMSITKSDSHHNSHTVNEILEVHNYGSSVSSFYDILTPVQLTLEYCRGLNPSDFYNIMMVSPTDTYYYSSSIDEFFNMFNTRSQHQHNFFELLIVLEGEIIQRIENKEYLYSAGSCCLINRNIIHTEKFVGEAKVLFIGLSVDFVKEIIDSNRTTYFKKEEKALDNPIFQFMESNLKDNTGKTYLDFSPTFQNQNSIQELHHISDSLIHSMLMPKLGSSFMIKGLLCELFQYIESDFHITPVKLSSSVDALLFSRISHLLEDTNGHMSRSRLEETLNYSGNYLNTIVNKYTGMCLFDYGMSFCLKKAEYMLKNTNDSISSIALKLGFSNRTHFYKLFKGKYGVTPKEFREVHGF